MCVCPTGWEGVNCDIEMDMCQSSPCTNGENFFGSALAKFDHIEKESDLRGLKQIKGMGNSWRRL